MANPEHLAILKRGVGKWNKWRKEHHEAVPDLTRAELQGMQLPDIDFTDARLGRANLSSGNLERADFTSADLTGADLREAQLSFAYFTFAKVPKGKLSKAKLFRASLGGTNLTGATLVEANLGMANLPETNFLGANLSQANLANASLLRTNLREANLIRAELRGADLAGAKLSEADFTEASAVDTHFANVDLSVAIGLDKIRHYGPSTVGIDTIYKSRGKIPEVFLRGCGVPDEFIAYIGSMVGRPIEFYSCFISYSTHDQEFAERLHADLQDKGVRCWFAPHDIKGGRKIHEQIDEAIRLHDRLLLILSEHSMSSEWVKTELAKARKRETKEGKRVLFPVRLVGFERLRDWECFDADTGKDSAREIREYFIPDFSTWKDHDTYQKAFGRLVGDLKASG